MPDSAQFFKDCVCTLDSVDSEGKLTGMAGATEKAILRLLDQKGVQVEQTLQEIKDNVEFKLPFSSRTKRSTVAIRDAKTRSIRVVMKGNIEYLLRMGYCNRMVSADGSVVDLTEAKTEEILQTLNEYAMKEAARQIGFASREYTEEEWNKLKEDSN